MTPRTAHIAFFLTAALAASGEAGPLIAFRPTATVGAGVVTLGDIADVRDADVAVVQRLSSIILGPVPEAGRETSLTFETVRSRLMAAGVSLVELEFSGSSSVTIRGKAEPTVDTPEREPRAASSDARQRATRAVVAAIERHVSARGMASVAVEATLLETEIANLAAAGAQGFDVSGGKAPWIGSQTFTLRFLDADERVREVKIDCVVSQRPSVLAARHALQKGHVLRPDDLVWKKAEAGSAGATDPSQLLGRETLQSIRVGQPIPVDAVRAIPLVRNGQFVTVTSRCGGVSVQRVMKAKADGAVGEAIPVLTLEDRKTVLVQVTGLQEAEVIASTPAVGTKPIGGLPPAAERILPAGHEQPAPERLRPAPRSGPRVLVNPSQPLSVPAGAVGE